MRTDLFSYVFKNIPRYSLTYLGMLLKYNHAVPWFYHLTPSLAIHGITVLKIVKQKPGVIEE